MHTKFLMCWNSITLLYWKAGIFQNKISRAVGSCRTDSRIKRVPAASVAVTFCTNDKRAAQVIEAGLMVLVCRYHLSPSREVAVSDNPLRLGGPIFLLPFYITYLFSLSYSVLSCSLLVFLYCGLYGAYIFPVFAGLFTCPSTAHILSHLLTTSSQLVFNVWCTMFHFNNWKHGASMNYFLKIDVCAEDRVL